MKPNKKAKGKRREALSTSDKTGIKKINAKDLLEAWNNAALQEQLSWHSKPRLHTAIFQEFRDLEPFRKPDDNAFPSADIREKFYRQQEDLIRKLDDIKAQMKWDDAHLEQFASLAVAFREAPSIEKYLTIRALYPELDIQVAMSGGFEPLVAIEEECEKFGVDPGLIAAAMDGSEPGIDALCLLLMLRIVEKSKIAGVGALQRRRAAISDAMINYLIAFMLEGADLSDSEIRLPASLILLIRHQLGALYGDYHNAFKSREARSRAAWLAGQRLKRGEKLSINRLMKFTGTPRATAARWLNSKDFQDELDFVRNRDSIMHKLKSKKRGLIKKRECETPLRFRTRFAVGRISAGDPGTVPVNTSEASYDPRQSFGARTAAQVAAARAQYRRVCAAVRCRPHHDLPGNLIWPAARPQDWQADHYQRRRRRRVAAASACRSGHAMNDPRALAHALGGELLGRNILAPGPGHSLTDRSLSIRLDPTAPEGFIVNSFAGDSPMVCRDYVRAAIGAGLVKPTIPRSSSKSPEANATDRDVDRRSTIALKLWNEGCDPRGTLVSIYLATRGLMIADDIANDVIRFHPALKTRAGLVGGMLALFRDIHTNEPCGIHRTFIDRSGRKLERKMLGRARGAAVKLDADEHVTLGLHIGEGIESCLAAWLAGFRSVWAVGAANAISTFPLLAGIETITILGEVDDGGTNYRAAYACANRWTDSGRVAFVVWPQVGGDFNDVWQEATR